MCAQFLIKARLRDLKERFGLTINLDSKNDLDQTWDERILPYKKAPVIVDKGRGPEVRLMNFSLIPSWSKESRVKFATHNARLETIDEKPTWKGPFQNHRCLVPLTDFIEPIYTGEYAGNMVSFHTHKHKLLAAAGVWSEWVDKKSGEVLESFAIITGDPSEFVKTLGHDRQPIFLNQKAFEEWLAAKKEDATKLKKLLLENIETNKFEVETDRPLKAGWEKRK